jgi:outer membrane biogenesis lipoprotein LolB
MKIRFHFAALCAAIALTGCVENMQVKASRFIDKLSSDAYQHYAKIISNKQSFGSRGGISFKSPWVNPSLSDVIEAASDGDARDVLHRVRLRRPP